MRVDVLCFGVLKDLLGCERQSMEFPDGVSVGSLLESLHPNVSAGDAMWRSIAVAVNREYAGVRTILNDGDEVALLPPVSGGNHAD